MCFLHQNLQSIGSEFNKLQYIVDKHRVDFLAVTEHWKSNEELQHYRLQGYNLASYFCRNEGEHGGSALYLKDNIIFKTRTDINNFSVPFAFECCAAQICQKNKNIILICVYRPDSTSDNFDIFLDKLSYILLHCVNEKADILADDFNIDLLSKTLKARTFISTISSFGLMVTIKEPTRICKTTSTCLDNIITNIEGFSSVTEEHISDHSAQKFMFSLKEYQTERVERKQIRDISQRTISKFKESLTNVNWSNVCDGSDGLDSEWNSFFAEFENIFNASFPMKTVCVQRTGKFLPTTQSIQTMKNVLDYLFILSTRTDEYKSEYRKAKIKYDVMITAERQKHFRETIQNSTNKSKTVWNIVNNTLGKQKNQVNKIKKAPDPQKLKEEFNNFFSNTPTQKSGNSSTVNLNAIKTNEKSFYMFEITESEIINVVKKMKNVKSTGWDGIPIKIIRESIDLIAKPMAQIMNRSFIEGIFPEALKIAVIKPLHKSGNYSDPNSYRPISLLTSFAKIFEKILAKRLLCFFRKFGILSNCQHGYIQGRSTETAIFELYQSIMSALESRELPLGIFLDLSKAFDCVEIDILLKKLEKYGIRDKQLKLLESYLKERPQ